jgi:hypothetical protein
VFAGGSGEWEVLRLQTAAGLAGQVALMASVKPLVEPKAGGTVGESLPAVEEGAAAQVSRTGNTFSIKLVLPAAGVYTLRLFARLPSPGDTEVDAGRRMFLHAADYLLNFTNPPQAYWRGCAGCAYPRTFGGEAVAHAPRQRRLAVGDVFNFVIELPGAETALVRFSPAVGGGGNGGTKTADSSNDVDLALTTVGALLGAPGRLSTRPVFAGSVRCRLPGNLTVYVRRRGQHAMDGALEYSCGSIASGGHRALPGGGVLPPSNVDGSIVGSACPRLTCLPELVQNRAVVTDTGDELGLRLVSHPQAAFAVTGKAQLQIELSTAAPARLVAQLGEVGGGNRGGDGGSGGGPSATLVSSAAGQQRHSIFIKFRRPWRYKLSVFAAGADDDDGGGGNDDDGAAVPADTSLWLAVEYTIDVAAVPKDENQCYPTAFVSWDRGCAECRLERPLSGRLLGGGAKHSVAVLLPAAMAAGVAVISDGRWQHLHVAASGEGECEPEAGQRWVGNFRAFDGHQATLMYKPLRASGGGGTMALVAADKYEALLRWDVAADGAPPPDDGEPTSSNRLWLTAAAVAVGLEPVVEAGWRADLDWGAAGEGTVLLSTTESAELVAELDFDWDWGEAAGDEQQQQQHTKIAGATLVQTTNKGTRHGVAVRLPAGRWRKFKLLLFGKQVASPVAADHPGPNRGESRLALLATYFVEGSQPAPLERRSFPKSFHAFQAQGCHLMAPTNGVIRRCTAPAPREGGPPLAEFKLVVPGAAAVVLLSNGSGSGSATRGGGGSVVVGHLALKGGVWQGQLGEAAAAKCSDGAVRVASLANEGASTYDILLEYTVDIAC